jgi:Holliday junction resolvase
MTELQIYHRTISFLQGRAWTVLCACPPSGTDARFPRCNLPRPARGAAIKGRRDEVDITACLGNVLLIIECKESLSASRANLNALGENDIQKLRRLTRTFSPSEFHSLLCRGHGLRLFPFTTIVTGLAVADIDEQIPVDFVVFEQRLDGESVWAGASIDRVTLALL